MFHPTFSPEQLRLARETGITDDRELADVLRRELSCTDAGHLRNVVRMLVLSHVAANERIRELQIAATHAADPSVLSSGFNR